MATRRLLTPHAIFAPPSFTGSGIMHSIHGDTRAVPTMRRLRSLVKGALLGSAYTPERHCQSCLTQLPAFLSRLPEMVTREATISPVITTCASVATRCASLSSGKEVIRYRPHRTGERCAFARLFRWRGASPSVADGAVCNGLRRACPLDTPSAGWRGWRWGPIFPVNDIRARAHRDIWKVAHPSPPWAPSRFRRVDHRSSSRRSATPRT